MMLRRNRLVASLATLFVCLPFVSFAQPEGKGPDFVKGQILVKFKEGVSDDDAKGLLNAVGARSKKVIDGIGVHVVELPPSADEHALANALKSESGIEFAEIDAILPPQGLTPNDSYYPQQWLLWTIRGADAWATTTGSSSVVIALVDTGVDANSYDLRTKMVPGINLYDSSAMWDYTGHGTQVAGVNASTNNSFGVAGVCWGCRIMPIRVSDVNGNASLSMIASGVTWATNNGAKIINIGYAATDSATVQTAAQDAWNRGAVVIAPAGNDDTTITGTFNSNPNQPYIITVGSVDEQLDTHLSWSNTGNNIDLVAGGCVITTGVSLTFKVVCGTSYSSAAVAGVAGLVLSAQPTLSPSGVEQILRQSAVDLGTAGWDTTFGYGRIDAAAAVALAAGGGTTKTNTSTSVTSGLNPSTSGQTVTFTASVSPSGASGTVLFLDAGVQIGSAVLSSGQATFSTSSLSAGTHSITASYGGNTSYNGSTSPAITQTVNTAAKLGTTTSLASSPNPSFVGQLVSFTATVSSSSATGTVTFKDGAVNLSTVAVTGGMATYSTSGLSAGGHSITAVYNGDATYNTSTSGTLSQTVNKTSTSLTVTSSLNPSTAGQQVSFTAVVSPSAATGAVAFMEGGVQVGSGALSNGQATWATSTLSAGSHSITAVYNGDGSYNGSTSPAVTQTVNSPTSTKADTITSISSSLNPSTYGQVVTLTATVTPSSSTGPVWFFDNGMAIGSGTLSGGIASFSTSSLSVGSHPIIASYGGDTTHNGSVSPTLSQTVNPATTTKTNTITSLTSSLNPSNSGQSVTFAASVSPSSATGTVTFFDGAAVLGTAPVSGGTASFSLSTLAAGNHSITASYGGNSSYNGSNSVVLTQVVNAAVISVDTIAPVAQLVSPQNGSSVSGNVNVSASATDNVRVSRMELYIAGTLSASSTSGSLTYRWNARKLAGTSQTLEVRAYDAAGNVGRATVSVNVTK